MSISVHTLIQQQGIAEGHQDRGMMEYGYGLYVNAYVTDDELSIPGDPWNNGQMGLYATERVPFYASQEQITKARKLARDRARQRYLREKGSR